MFRRHTVPEAQAAADGADTLRTEHGAFRERRGDSLLEKSRSPWRERWQDGGSRSFSGADGDLRVFGAFYEGAPLQSRQSASGPAPPARM